MIEFTADTTGFRRRMRRAILMARKAETRRDLTPGEALARPAHLGPEYRLRSVAGPAGLTGEHLEGRAGKLDHHGRQLIYLRRGRSLAWFEWLDVGQGRLEFPERHLAGLETR